MDKKLLWVTAASCAVLFLLSLSMDFIPSPGIVKSNIEVDPYPILDKCPDLKARIPQSLDFLMTYPESQTMMSIDATQNCEECHGMISTEIYHPTTFEDSILEIKCMDCHDIENHATHKPCETCHGVEDLGTISHPVGEGIYDKNTNTWVSCTSTCHTIHVAPMQGAFLCLRCHEDK